MTAPRSKGRALHRRNRRNATRSRLARSIQRLHDVCGVYTTAFLANSMLDLAGWTASSALAGKRLLEPAAGDGSLVLPAVQRLLTSLGEDVHSADIDGAITAFEIVPALALQLRASVRAMLSEAGVAPRRSSMLAKSWVRSGDFLLWDDRLSTFDVVVSNPPYVRASKVPPLLSKRYSSAGLPRADLSLLFADKMCSLLAHTGTAVLLTSDRLVSAVHGGAIARKLVTANELTLRLELDGDLAFDRPVSAYPGVFVFKRSAQRMTSKIPEAIRIQDQDALSALVRASSTLNAVPGSRPEPLTSAFSDSETTRKVLEKFAAWPTLPEAGCSIRCGTALGVKEAFLVPRAGTKIEASLRKPFFDTADFGASGLPPTDVIVTLDETGLVSLKKYPFAARHLTKWKAALQARSCVRGPDDWYRTIDRVDRRLLTEDKLLVSGVARACRLKVDRAGVVPSNAIYMVFSHKWPLDCLASYLSSGVMDFYVRRFGQRYAGGAFRYTAKVLSQIRIPRWESLAPHHQQLLSRCPGSSVGVRNWVSSQLGVAPGEWAELALGDSQ